MQVIAHLTIDINWTLKWLGVNMMIGQYCKENKQHCDRIEKYMYSDSEFDIKFTCGFHFYHKECSSIFKCC